jgi:hypothetical protein
MGIENLQGHGMHLDLMRDAASSFPKIENESNIRSLRIWHCKYKSLRDVAKLESLEELVIATFPDDTLDFLLSLRRLRFLGILHMPKVTTLAGLENLAALETLSLATSPAWDAAKKLTVVESLEPISRISSLKHIELFGVCSANKSLAMLEQCQGLQTARFSGYPKGEVERFFSTTKVINQSNPEPLFAAT